MNKLSTILVYALLLQGCTYAVSPLFREKADRSITFDQLLADPDLYKGKVLILGGTIVETAVKQKGTLITVAERPLDYWGKPIRTTRTGGRFFLFHPDALDAFLYAPGRDLTVWPRSLNKAPSSGTRSSSIRS
jgi:outer membrane lipoprotein